MVRCCAWLSVTSLAAVSKLLKRLGIRYKRGRRSLHSPDERYEPKRYRLDICRFRSKYQPEQSVFLYLDEFTYYRQPTVARAYAPLGHQALAPLSHQSDTAGRIIAALNAVTGQVTARQFTKLTLPRLSDFYALLVQTYPQAEVIYLALDNWPVHFHPDVLARLMPQDAAADFRLPPNWPSHPSSRAKLDTLPIQLLPLPTYAPWLNPIEKLWLWLYQDCLFLHRSADDWLYLKQQVQSFLDQFQHGSSQLLRYVGLLPY
jgi:hypothetical protein